MAGFIDPETKKIFVTTTTLRSYALRCVAGSCQPCAALLGAAPLTVGQSEANAVQVADDAVSRFHFELLREGSRLTLRDLGSTNGTQVEGVFVREALVSPGQHIRIGHTEFVVEDPLANSEVEVFPEASFGALVGGSEPMRILFAQLKRAAPSDATVLLLGESGTGKELVAQELHQRSARRDGPFVIVDCGALPEDLIESELFGHEKGAFTGAVAERQGAVEAADSGTLFLDEIGELPLTLQPKLLRVLESKTCKRLGGNQHRAIDVRFVAATNRNLRAEVNRGTFREDLFWRLAVIELTIPPLRERAEDIPMLVEAMLEQTGLNPSKPVFDQETLARAMTLPWRGNVRELRNFVERTAVLGATALPPTALEPQPCADAGPEVRDDLPFKQAKELWNDHFEQIYLERRLRNAEGNLSRLAREAELGRAHVLKLLKKHGLRR